MKTKSRAITIWGLSLAGLLVAVGLWLGLRGETGRERWFGRLQEWTPRPWIPGWPDEMNHTLQRVQRLCAQYSMSDADLDYIEELIQRGRRVLVDPFDPARDSLKSPAVVDVMIGERALGAVHARLFDDAPLATNQLTRVRQWMLDGLSHPRAQERVNAIVNLVQTRLAFDPAIEAKIRPMLEDPDPDVKAMARLQLGYNADNKASADARGYKLFWQQSGYALEPVR